MKQSDTRDLLDQPKTAVVLPKLGSSSLKNSRTIRWGILGTGKVASDFIRGLSQVPNAMLGGIAGRTFLHAQRLSALAGCKVYETYDSILQDPSIDIVYIATPAHCHMNDCLKALDHGKAILCEKPFALSSHQAQTIIDCARKRGLFCMEAMWMRLVPLITEVQHLVSTGQIGRPLFIRGDFAYPLEPDPTSSMFNPDTGGGALLDRGVYLLSLAHALLGKPERISSLAHIGSTGVDEQCSMTLQYKGGALAQFSASMRTLGTNGVYIQGDRGTIHIHPPFYCPHQVSVQSFKPASPRQASPVHLTKTHHLKRKILESRLGYSAATTLRSLARYRPRAHKIWEIRHFPGNGYQFEIAEATNCLLQGALESPQMPHLATLEVMAMLDEARKSWG